jgi:predicted  nucleic acid-binding Zn-ribbon protein
MTVSPHALRELHRLHQQVADLRGRLGRGPRRVHIGQQAVLRYENQLAEAKNAWKKARMESDDQQVRLKQRETKIEELQKKLNECKRNEEYKILREQIAAEKQANSVLEDEILDKLDRMDQLEAQAKEAEISLAKARQDLEKTQHTVNGEQGSLQSELDRVTAELERAEAALPADFKQDYHRLIRAHGDRGLAPVDGESCSGCCTILTPQTMNELYLARPVFCKSCGCLLYLPEDRSVGSVKS